MNQVKLQNLTKNEANAWEERILRLIMKKVLHKFYYETKDFNRFASLIQNDNSLKEYYQEDIFVYAFFNIDVEKNEYNWQSHIYLHPDKDYMVFYKNRDIEHGVYYGTIEDFIELAKASKLNHTFRDVVNFYWHAFEKECLEEKI